MKPIKSLDFSNKFPAGGKQPKRWRGIVSLSFGFLAVLSLVALSHYSGFSQAQSDDGWEAQVPTDHGHDHGPGEEHSHDEGGHEEGEHAHEGVEEKVAQVTHWTDDFEIFLEHKLLIVGTPTRFITHVTHLDTWEPRRQGPVTFVLQQGNQKPIEETVEAPERDGIYIPALTFPKVGEWQVSLRIPHNGSDRVVELPAFQVYADLDEAYHANESEGPEGIAFLKEQQWKIVTATEPVVRRPMTEHLRVVGKISACPERMASVVPPVTGILLGPDEGSLPRIGDHVEAGQVLAHVQPPLAGTDLLTFLSNQTQIQSLQAEITIKAAEAKAEVERTQVTLASAKSLVGRIGPLRETSARSAREVDEAEFALQKAQTDISSAEKLRETYEEVLAQLKSTPNHIHIEDGFPAVPLKSPTSGWIVEMDATVGENVRAEAPVFTVLDHSCVFLEARVQESKLSQLSEDLNADFETMDAPGVLRPVLGEGGGRLVYLGKVVDEQNRTAPIVYEIPNPDGNLRIGMAVNVDLETQHVEEGLSIPVSALVDVDGRYVAYVQVSGETFEKRDLEIGIRDNAHVQILSGLSEGERVVSKGAYAVRLASVSTTLPAHGHAH